MKMAGWVFADFFLLWAFLREAWMNRLTPKAGKQKIKYLHEPGRGSSFVLRSRFPGS